MKILNPIAGSSSSGSTLRTRHRLAGLYMILYACLQTIRAFRDHELGSLTLLFFVLLVFAVVLYLINAVAPVAPFVYSLI